MTAAPRSRHHSGLRDPLDDWEQHGRHHRYAEGVAHKLAGVDLSPEGSVLFAVPVDGSTRAWWMSTLPFLVAWKGAAAYSRRDLAVISP